MGEVRKGHSPVLVQQRSRNHQGIRTPGAERCTPPGNRGGAPGHSGRVHGRGRAETGDAVSLAGGAGEGFGKGAAPIRSGAL